MELRTLAERVLRSPLLDDKLASPESLEDLAPGAEVQPPVWPARPERLRLDQPGPRPGFPSLGQLEQASVRGRVLHFFANHELLALELMALMLLRFPEAPRAFRLGLGRTLVDEQRHMRLYLDRMQDFGVEFGDLAPSPFFWSCLAGAPDPASFVAGMSLTLEQANLDHCVHYGAAFRTVGDVKTEQVLREVCEDEVRHVAHGLHWLRRWKDADESDWSAWTSRLQRPLSPARARGKSFDVGLRRRAGIDEDSIQRLAVWRNSKGRRPRVHLLNLGCEVEQRDVDWHVDGVTEQLRSDLATLPLLWAARDDVVLAPRAPSVEHLSQLSRLGLELAQVVQVRPDDAGEDLPFGDIRPERAALWPRSAWLHLTGARLCRTLEDLRSVLDEGGPWVLKTELSSSGRGLRRVRGSLDDNTLGWVQRHLPLTAEPWLDRVLDLSAVYRGRRLLGITRPLCGPGGRYQGHLVGHAFHGLDDELGRFIGQQRLPQRYGELGRELALEGLWGVDLLVYREDGQLRLREVVELNPRRTFGHIAHELRPRVRGYGLLRILGLERAAALPEPRFEGGQLVAGAVCLTDPSAARRFVAVLEVLAPGALPQP
jgi:uncharacterized ferritin-like protein (DUF455 family)